MSARPLAPRAARRDARLRARARVPVRRRHPRDGGRRRDRADPARLLVEPRADRARPRRGAAAGRGRGGRPVRRGADPRHARKPLQAPLRRDAALPDPGLPAAARERRAAARHRLQLGALDDRGGAAPATARSGSTRLSRRSSRRAASRASSASPTRATSSPTRASCRSRTARSTSSSRTASSSTSRSPTSRSRSVDIRRVLEPGGYSWVQMPNALGVLNLVRLAQRRFREGDAFEVRYWMPSELKRRLRPDRADGALDGRLLHAEPAEARPRPAAAARFARSCRSPSC